LAAILLLLDNRRCLSPFLINLPVWTGFLFPVLQLQHQHHAEMCFPPLNYPSFDTGQIKKFCKSIFKKLYLCPHWNVPEQFKEELRLLYKIEPLLQAAATVHPSE
jgi:hypothetical protein